MVPEQALAAMRVVMTININFFVLRLRRSMDRRIALKQIVLLQLVTAVQLPERLQVSGRNWWVKPR